RLSEIDRQAETTGHESVVPLASDPAEPGVKAPRKLPWTRRFGSQIPWKLSGGVIAAGLVIGLFIYGADPYGGANKNADSLLGPASRAESSTAASKQTTSSSKDTVIPEAAAGSGSNSPSSDNRVMLDQNG